MTSFEMTTGAKHAKALNGVRSMVLRALAAPFRRLLRAQREYLAIQHLHGLEREQLEDVGLDRSEIEAAVRGRRR